MKWNRRGPHADLRYSFHHFAIIPRRSSRLRCGRAHLRRPLQHQLGILCTVNSLGPTISFPSASYQPDAALFEAGPRASHSCINPISTNGSTSFVRNDVIIDAGECSSIDRLREKLYINPNQPHPSSPTFKQDVSSQTFLANCDFTRSIVRFHSNTPQQMQLPQHRPGFETGPK